MYREYPPPRALAGVIECLWRRDLSATDADPSGVILPDGRIDVIWVAGDEPRLAGPQTHHLPRPLEPPFVAVGARFHPGTAPSLLRISARDLVNEHQPLSAVDTTAATTLAARLEAILEPADAFEGLLAALARLADRADPIDPLVRRATELLDRREATIADAARTLALSERQMQRRFREHVGYGPKTLQRILRFRRFVAELARGREEAGGLAGIAAATGYADQAHLTRESRELSGLSPAMLDQLWRA